MRTYLLIRVDRECGMHRIVTDRARVNNEHHRWELRQAADIAAVLDLPLDAFLPQDITAPYHICRDTGPPRAAGRVIALCHHERWDGAGYPHGLGGEEIPLGGGFAPWRTCSTR